MVANLVAWIGRSDLRAAKGEEDSGVGPIAQAVLASRYAEIHLLSDFSAGDSKNYIKWLAPKTEAKIHLHAVKLSSPINFGEIYEGVVAVLNKIRGAGVELTFHLSPGTPAMQSVWILLGKTTHPARLIQSSPEAGVEEAKIPFDISAEFIPQLLQQSDKRLTDLAQCSTTESPEFSDIVHQSAVMKRVISQATRIAVRSIPVLIEGESGTGKELLARAIHRASPRYGKPFVPVNCGAIPLELVESEFFGHKKGAFTGAVADRKGYFEQAHEGTLFLDEIGELPLQVQVRLLRTLQEGDVTPLGAARLAPLMSGVLRQRTGRLSRRWRQADSGRICFTGLAVAIIKLPRSA